MATSSSQTPTPSLSTFHDLLKIPEDERFHEVLDGEVVPKMMPSGPHGLSQSALNGWLYPRFCRQPNGAQRPGGWWILTEVEVELAPHQIVRPDLAGWRRERMAEVPASSPLKIRPDWTCEILTDGNGRRRDGVQKRRIYADSQVPHYWIIDVERRVLTVLRWTDRGYIEVLTAGPHEQVRAEPFDGLELPVAVLFGADLP